MATVYEIKIKTTSPWCRYTEDQVKKILEDLISQYEYLGMKFECTEIEVKTK